ncbi:hypothetical protein AB1N83_009640 [Pleurotus pulmonarius]
MSDSVILTDVRSLEGLNTGTYITVSGAIFLMYEYLLMLASEVQYVWHVKWGVGKVLYLLSRYPLLIVSVMKLHRASAHSVSAAECSGLYSISSYASVFATFIAEVILAVRVWALWHRRIWLSAYLACVAVGGIVIAIVDVIKAVRNVAYVSATSIESLSYPGCLTINEAGKSTYSSYIFLVLHGAFVFFLMVIVWYKSFHHSVSVSSMMYTFYTDGVIYFAAISGISIANMIFNLNQPPEYINFLLPTQAAVHSVLSTRMLLNLRQSAQRDNSGVNSMLGPNTRHQITPIRFASAVSVDSTASAA